MEKKQTQTPVKTAYMYMDNYREMQRYINEAVSEAEQVEGIERYNISAERAFLASIRECRTETIILFTHINKALESLREDAEATGELYKYDALCAHYIDGKSYEEISRESGSGKNTPKRWCNTMMNRLAIKLFGAKAMELTGGCRKFD